MANGDVNIPNPRIKDLTDQRYGRLVVRSYVGRHRTKGVMWRCDCDCGNIKDINSRDLAKGDTKSCGCLRAERTSDRFSIYNNRDETEYFRQNSDRLKYPAEYRVLHNIKSRCYNPNANGFCWYGKKGISVCDRWRFGDGQNSALACFVYDMGRRPSPNLSIDRIDTSGNYEPGNCRWASSATQNRNTCRNRWVYLNGDRLILKDAAKRLGVSSECIRGRMRRKEIGLQEAIDQLAAKRR